MRHQSAWLLSGLLLLGLSVTASAADREVIDSPMYQNPTFPTPPVTVDHFDARASWFAALKRPEAELKCKVCETITLAQGRNLKNLQEFVPVLLETFNDKNAAPAVKLSAARTLVVLDSKAACESFLQRAKSDAIELREIIEPALAKWDFQPAREFWLATLGDEKKQLREKILAMRCLAAVQENRAIEPLKKMLPERYDFVLLSEAANALGLLLDSGLEADAEGLLSDPKRSSLPRRLAAVSLLQRHRSEKCILLLQRLVKDEEPSAVTFAAETLLRIDPKHLLVSLELLHDSKDPQHRLIAVEVVRRLPTLDRIDRLLKSFADDHLHVRTQARKALFELANEPSQKSRLIDGCMANLNTQDWRSLEQSLLLLAQLDHAPAAPKMVPHLNHERHEVFLSAAWAIRKLNVPEIAPAVLAHIQSKLPQRKKMTEASPLLSTYYDHQMSQLNQLLGQQKYQPADATLRQFIPMGAGFGNESRCGAIWALGLIHEGKAVPELGKAFTQRIAETRVIPPEDVPVARMSAIAIGRMKASAELSGLRAFNFKKQYTADSLNDSTGWAIEQIAGEEMQDPELIRITKRDWFLAPLEKK